MLLQDVLKASSKCLEDVLKTSWQNLLNSSCKRTTKINIFVLKTSWRRLHQDERLLGMHYRRLFGLYSRKWKATILNYSNYVSFSLQDWGMRMSMLAGLKVSSLTCKCVLYRPELNAKGRGGGGDIELNFEGLDLKYTKGWCSKCRWEKFGHLSSCHVYFQSYGL